MSTGGGWVVGFHLKKNDCEPVSPHTVFPHINICCYKKVLGLIKFLFFNEVFFINTHYFMYEKIFPWTQL